MQTIIKARKIELTAEQKAYIRKKMDMLEKYLGQVKALKCEVEVGPIVGRLSRAKIYRAEVNLSLPGELLRVEKTEKDIFKAVDKVKDHLARSIKRYKEKHKNVK